MRERRLFAIEIMPLIRAGYPMVWADETSINSWIQPKKMFRPANDQHFRIPLPSTKHAQLTIYTAVGNCMANPYFHLGSSTNIDEFFDFAIRLRGCVSERRIRPLLILGKYLDVGPNPGLSPLCPASPRLAFIGPHLGRVCLAKTENTDLTKNEPVGRRYETFTLFNPFPCCADNHPAHRNTDLLRRLERHFLVTFQPSYTPWFNSCEWLFAYLKPKLRKALLLRSLRGDYSRDQMIDVVQRVLESVPLQVVKNLGRASTPHLQRVIP